MFSVQACSSSSYDVLERECMVFEAVSCHSQLYGSSRSRDKCLRLYWDRGKPSTNDFLKLSGVMRDWGVLLWQCLLTLRKVTWRLSKGRVRDHSLYKDKKKKA